MKTVTPVLKRTRVKAERYEVCPHCMQEIQEKSTFMDADDYVYHSSCKDKGPIEYLDPEKCRQEFLKAFPSWGAAQKAAKKTAQQNVSTHAGSINKNIAGKEYRFEWRANLALDGTRSPEDVTVVKPADMPEDLWYQSHDAIQIEADAAAKAAQKASRSPGKAASTWLDVAMKTAQMSDVDPLDVAPEEEDDEKAVHVANQMGFDASGEPYITIDDGLLADGLGAFKDTFLNYQSGKEGDTLAAWMMAISHDPQYARIAVKLQKLHKLIGEIYSGVVEIAKGDAKVAAVLGEIKTGADKSGASKISEDLALKFVSSLTDPSVKWCFFELILARSKEERAEILSDWRNIALINRVLSKFQDLPEGARNVVMKMAENEMKYKKVPDMVDVNRHEILPMRPGDDPSFENAVRVLEDVASVRGKTKTAQQLEMSHYEKTLRCAEESPVEFEAMCQRMGHNTQHYLELAKILDTLEKSDSHAKALSNGIKR